MNKTGTYEVWSWDHKDTAPLKEVMECTKQHLDWELYFVEGHLMAIMAPTIEDAQAALNDEFMLDELDQDDDFDPQLVLAS